ncbi:hypothetical protein [Sphingobium yanoikuyae]|uniref:Uncharacterized protein n=1 Tax=Sphingobium yanoikuyae TaxID=13690 RepID=A0A9X7YBT5_SPHYA|nr:hypothetical protein [Sphingobium yanoikuyae]QNG44712.1 hypothetical protein H3V42_23140 [Sphingobium yanoikuyae]
MTASFELVTKQNVVQLQSVDLLARYVGTATAEIDGKVAGVAADALAAQDAAADAAASKVEALDGASTSQAGAQVASDQAWGFRYGSLAAGAADPDLETGDAFDVWATDGSGRWYSGVKTGPSSTEEIPYSDRATLKVLAVSLFTDLAGRWIPLGMDAVQTSGHSVKGIGAARYVYDASVDAAYVEDHPRSSVMTANGRGFRIAEDLIDAKMLGARSGQDSAAAIDETMQLAYEMGHSLCTLYGEGSEPYLIEGPGKTDPTDPGSTFQRGVMSLRPDVQIAIWGAWLQIKSADHDKNGPTMFGHHKWNWPDLGNAGVLGDFTLDGNMYDAERNPGGIPFDDGRDGSGVFDEGAVYQFQHGISVYKSSGTITIGRAKCINMRGNGLEIGMTSSTDNWIAACQIERLDPADIFREALGIYNCRALTIGELIWRGGNGLWVALLNIERHSNDDQIMNIHVGRIVADFTTGLSPTERTPGITNAAEREAARRMTRRIVSVSDFYDLFVDNRFDGRGINVTIGELIGVQACLTNYNFANVRIGRCTLSQPHDEDLTGHKLVPEDGGSVDAIRCHGVTYDSEGAAILPTGLYGFSFDAPPRITGHYAHAIWISNYAEILIPDGTIVEGTKKSAVRLDNSSGWCGHVRATNCGLTTARAYAVEVWGAKGPLFVRDPVAIDTRAGASRTMQGAVQLNGASVNHVEVSGARNLNTFGTVPVVNVGDAAVAVGNMDMAAPVHGFSTPVAFATVDRGFEVNGNVVVGDMAGAADTNISVRAPTGFKANVTWLVGSEFRYQIQQTPDGTQQSLRAAGEDVIVEQRSLAAGGMDFPTISYAKPLRIGGFTLWPTAAGIWRTKAAPDPTTDTDGAAVGDQTGA